MCDLCEGQNQMCAVPGPGCVRQMYQVAETMPHQGGPRKKGEGIKTVVCDAHLCLVVPGYQEVDTRPVHKIDPKHALGQLLTAHQKLCSTAGSPKEDRESHSGADGEST